MDGVFVIREKFQEIYSQHSRIIDKGTQFIMALITFWLINSNIGFMKAAASPVVSVALAVICTFFPVIITVIAATGLILLHMYAVSLGMLAGTALIFLIMYIFYFRLTPKMALVVVLTPIAFALKIPFAVPLAYALLSTPIAMVAVICGTIVYYMMEYVKKAASGIEDSGIAALLSQIPAYVKQVFQNKEMWITIGAFLIAFLVVYTVRRQSMNHAWKIAIVAGAIINIVVNTVGDIALGVHTSYGSLIIGSIVAVIVGLVLELFFFAVDYTKSESLQYEDDEYYYYVKAVPKLKVAKPKKTVKKINEHQETEIMDTESVRNRRNRRNEHGERSERKGSGRRNSSEDSKRSARARKKENIDEILLEKSLKKERR